MKRFKNVDTEEAAKKILIEFSVFWDVVEHYEALNMFSYMWKENTVAEYMEDERKLILY